MPDLSLNTISVLNEFFLTPMTLCSPQYSERKNLISFTMVKKSRQADIMKRQLLNQVKVTVPPLKQTSIPLTCHWAEQTISAHLCLYLFFFGQETDYSKNSKTVGCVVVFVCHDKTEEIDFELDSFFFFLPSSSLQAQHHSQCQSGFEDAWENALNHCCTHCRLFFLPLISPEGSLHHALDEMSLTASQSPMIQF